MTRAYGHSQAFASLKGVQEQIHGNLTSAQYLKVLDDLIANALGPIICASSFLDIFFPKIVAWQNKFTKRKASSRAREDLPSFVVIFLIQSDPEQKLKALAEARLDRAAYFEAIRQWLDLLAPFDELMQQTELTQKQLLHVQFCLLQAGVKPESFPYAAYKEVRFWLHMALNFKEMILEKYTRMCLSTAQRDYVTMSHLVDLDDIVQNYLVVASRAIDRCDSHKGVLTTYIQQWLLTARHHVMRTHSERNEVKASEIKVSVSDDDSNEILDILNVANIEDTTTIDEDIEREESISRVQYLARAFDTQGYGRLLLGISPYLTAKERSKLASMQVEPALVR